jgi:hypothetical protein
MIAVPDTWEDRCGGGSHWSHEFKTSLQNIVIPCLKITIITFTIVIVTKIR